LRTESILYEGWWKDAHDELSKNILVDEAWKELRTKGCNREEWAEHIKWAGEAGRYNGISIPEPRRARSGSWTLGHTPVYKGKGKGKSKAKGKSKGKGKSNQG
jgi:hypothetical protein